MRVVAFAMLIACSSKTEDKAKPVQPPVAQKATPIWASGRVTHFDATTFRPDRYTYDAAGKLVEKTYFEARIVYAYDTKHRLASVTRESSGDVVERAVLEYCDEPK